LKWHQNMEHKKIEELKQSIEKLNKLSLDEKTNLLDSIEMLWLNSNVRKKKKDIIMSDNSNQNVLRIRQLLAAAWSEDLKE